MLQTVGVIVSIVLYGMLIISPFRSIEWLATATSLSLGVISLVFLLKASQIAYGPSLAIKRMMIYTGLISLGMVNIVVCNTLVNSLIPAEIPYPLILALSKIALYTIIYAPIMYFCYRYKLIQLPSVKSNRAAVV